MPEFSEFEEIAETTQARTVTLSGASSALLFSAIAALEARWQWTKEGGLSTEDWDYVEATLAGAAQELTAEAEMITSAGIISIYAGSTIPDGWLECDGGVKLQADYALLFAAIGTTWNLGGEPSNSFRLPDLRGRAAIGSGTGTGLTNRVLGTIGGAQTHTLTATELAGHNHSTPVGDSGGSGTGNVQKIANAGVLTNTNPYTNMPTSIAGGDGAHNNMQPYAVTKMIISTGE